MYILYNFTLPRFDVGGNIQRFVHRQTHVLPIALVPFLCLLASCLSDVKLTLPSRLHTTNFFPPAGLSLQHWVMAEFIWSAQKWDRKIVSLSAHFSLSTRTDQEEHRRRGFFRTEIINLCVCILEYSGFDKFYPFTSRCAAQFSCNIHTGCLNSESSMWVVRCITSLHTLSHWKSAFRHKSAGEW